MPSGVGSIEHWMPPWRAASIARRDTTRSSNWSSGRRLVAPTTVPLASTVIRSAGPASTMSFPSGSTNRWVIRSIPPRKRTSGAGITPLVSDSSRAATIFASDTHRRSAASPSPSPMAFRRSAARASTAWGSRFRTMPSVSIAIPPTAWLPKPPAPPNCAAARPSMTTTRPQAARHAKHTVRAGFMEFLIAMQPIGWTGGRSEAKMLVWSGVGDKPDSSENPSGLDGCTPPRHSFGYQ